MSFMLPLRMFVVALLLVLSVVGSWAALPKDWPTCVLGSDGYNDCLRKAIQSALKSLRNGNKELGINSIDPLRVSSMSIKQGTGAVGIDLDFKDLDIHGLSRCQLLTAKNDWKTIEVSAYCKNASITSQYKINGKILTLPIKGEGNCQVLSGYLETNISGTLNEVERRGKKYFNLTSYNMKLDLKDVKLNFENLFNGNKGLSDGMNKFINENSDYIMNEINPVLTKAFLRAYAEVAKRVFYIVPSNEINVK